MSQQELADYADVAKMTVHRIETAQFSATLDVLLSLARALNTPVYELLRVPGLDEPTEKPARPE